MSYSRRQGGSYEGRRGHGEGFKRCPVEMEKKEYGVLVYWLTGLSDKHLKKK